MSDKPVITNRPILKDSQPEITDDDNKPADTTPVTEDMPKDAPLPSGKVKVEPITPDLEAPRPNGPETRTDDTAPDEPSNKKDEQEDEATIKAAAERQAELDKLADSHQYYLPINQVEKRRTKHYVIIGVISIVILAAAWADLALDAGLITIPGVTAPTHFFK